MKKSLFSLKDPKMGMWKDPFLLIGANEEVKQALKENYDRVGRVGKIPDDVNGNEVYFLGIFDDNTGKYELLESPEYLCTAENLK